jgi:hypothetical protein
VDRSGVQLVFDAVQEFAQLVPAAPSQIIVIDVHGRVVREAGRSDRVSLAGLPAGAYVLRVQAQDAVTTFRLVKP